MLNYIWLALVMFGVLAAGFKGQMKEVGEGALKGADTAVTLSLGLIGVMAVWLGLMRLAEKSGLIQILARALRPVMRWLFPEVPEDHPAMGAMIVNMAANMLGLSNAATPFGIKAMHHLEKLNKTPGVASNAMCTFLTINTSSIQLIPASAVAVLVAAKSQNPTAIIGTAFLATVCSTAAGLVSVKFLEKLPFFRLPPAISDEERAKLNAGKKEEAKEETKEETKLNPMPSWGRLVLGLYLACFAFFFFLNAYPDWFQGKFGGWFDRTLTEDFLRQTTLEKWVNGISQLALPFLITFFPLYAVLRGIKVYEEFVEGAKEGFPTVVRIISFLVAMIMAISIFRSAGGFEMLTGLLKPALDFVGFPPDLVPMALMRPLSGSGTFGLFTDLVKNLGPDHIVTRMAATIYGSTETTFYVVAVYFGAVSIRNTRHSILAGLIADGAGMVASVIICRMMFH